MTETECFLKLINNITKVFLDDYLEKNPNLPRSLLLSGFTMELQVRDICFACIVSLDVSCFTIR